MATPYSLTVLGETASTQDWARAHLGDEPLVVVAHRQTKGRGRSGAEWETAPRAVAASVAMRPSWPSSDWPLIPLVAGVAAHDTLGDATALKWPNDILVGEDKLAGILVEGGDGSVVVGLGVNLFWPSPPEGVTALETVDPGPDLGPALARSWAERFLEMMGRPVVEWPRERYREVCRTIGREISWEPSGSGTAIDVDERGGLVVRTGAGEVVLTSGAVRHVRPLR